MGKKIFILIILLFNNYYSFAQRSYEVLGLPDGDEVGDSLAKAIPLLIIGFFITYITIWSKKDTSKISGTATNIGCFGMIVMGIGIVFLIPLLTWLEYISVSIISVGFMIFVTGGIIYIIYSWLTKK